MTYIFPSRMSEKESNDEMISISTSKVRNKMTYIYPLRMTMKQNDDERIRTSRNVEIKEEIAFSIIKYDNARVSTAMKSDEMISTSLNM